MTPTEIITADAKSKGIDPKPIIQAMTQAVNSKKGILLKAENSILFLLRIGEGAVEAHLFTVHSPLKVAKALIDFIKKVRSSDIKVLYGSEEVPQLTKLLGNLDVIVEPSDNPKYKWMART